MIFDYRAYWTIYALLMLAWCASLPVAIKYGPRTGNLWMGGTASAFCLVLFVNYIDWLWS